MSSHMNFVEVQDFWSAPFFLFKYRELIMQEMKNRGYNVSEEWLDKNYRGKVCAPHNYLKEYKINKPIYKEHDAAYYDECIENLAQKDIFIQLYIHIKILIENK